MPTRRSSAATVKPSMPGEHHVEHDEIDRLRIGRQSFEGRLATLDDRHLVAVGLEVEAESIGEMAFVLDDQDVAHDGGAAGNCTVNVLP